MDVFALPAVVDDDILKNLGPLTPLAGIWEGGQGIDTAPSKTGPLETRYRERITFQPAGPFINGPQVLYGLRYTATAWVLEKKILSPRREDPFYEKTGYCLWDAKEQQVMHCFASPRGVMIHAGGYSDLHATSISLSAEAASETYGILSNPFLNDAFKPVRYDLKITLHGDGSFSYAEDTLLKIYGKETPFHHTDQNKLLRSPDLIRGFDF